MSRNSKVILSAIIAIAMVSTLFVVVPINGVFITSYIFAVIAICGIASTVYIYDKENAIIGLSYIYTSIIYAILNVMFSFVAYLIHLSVLWTFVIHIILFAIFAMRIIILSVGSDYLNNVDKKNEAKHKEFLNDKKDYWEE